MPNQVDVVGVLRNNNVVRLAGSNLTDIDGNAINPASYTDFSDSLLPSPVGKKGLAVYLSGIGLHGSVWVSDDTSYWPINGSRILLDIFADGKYAIFPESTFISTTPSSAASGADTLLTSAGANGLTAAAAVGSYIYISGGTGWVVGYHKIAAIAVDTTGLTIQIDTPYSASFGTPTIALKNTKVPYRTISIPALRANSALLLDLSGNAGGAVGSKSFYAELGGTSFWTAISTVNPVNSVARVAIQNVSDTSVQIGAMRATLVAQTGGDATAPQAGAINTSAPTSLILYVQNSVANEKVGYTRGIVEVMV